MTDTSDDLGLDLINEYAYAIGMLTIYWATLENSLTTVIERLIGTNEITAECIASTVDKAAGRASIIQRLVLRPGESPSGEWRDCMLGLCDQVASKLGPTRNRLIHDEWHPSAEGMKRRNATLRIRQPSAGEAKTLLRNPAALSHIPEIEETTGLVVDVMFHLTMLSLGFLSWKKTGRIPAVPEQSIQASKGIPRVLPPQGE